MNVIGNYLDNGGNLYISGQDLGHECNEYPGDSIQTTFSTIIYMQNLEGMMQEFHLYKVYQAIPYQMD